MASAVIGRCGPIAIIGVRCHYCSRSVHPKEVNRFGDDGQIIQCFQCRDREAVAIEAFHPPPECGLCRRSFRELALAERTESVSMFPHWIDREYTMLCARCDRSHVMKRADLYRDTAFGWQRKLR